MTFSARHRRLLWPQGGQPTPTNQPASDGARRMPSGLKVPRKRHARDFLPSLLLLRLLLLLFVIPIVSRRAAAAREREIIINTGRTTRLSLFLPPSALSSPPASRILHSRVFSFARGDARSATHQDPPRGGLPFRINLSRLVACAYFYYKF